MPIIQLSFPNPLNTSVQVGDNAYFSNPTPVSTTGNPFGGQWESTTTPHMTNDIDGVVDLGEIVAIIPWDGTNSFIQCDMDQVLFNKYFSQIQSPVCTTTNTNIVNPGNQGSGNCANHLPRIDVEPFYNPVYISTYPFHPVTGVNILPHNLGIPAIAGLTNIGYFQVKWFFENPSVNFNDVSFHSVKETTVVGGCLVSSSKSGFDPNMNNYWQAYTGITMNTNGNTFNGDINGDPIFYTGTTTPIPMGANVNGSVLFIANDVVTGLPLATSNGEGNNFQAFFDWVNTHFPGVTNSSMTYNDYFSAVSSYGIRQPVLGVQSSVLLGVAPTVTIVTTTNCVGTGSYIMFSKDNKANMSSILGYYASVEYRNSSQIKSELFNVGADFFESSK
jgi:hypothetical protein